MYAISATVKNSVIIFCDTFNNAYENTKALFNAF